MSWPALAISMAFAEMTAEGGGLDATHASRGDGHHTFRRAYLPAGSASALRLPAQHVQKSVVAFVARELVDRQLAPLHRQFHRPGLLPGVRIRHRELVEQRVGVDAGETLHQRPVPAGVPPGDMRPVVIEVHRLDHQRVAVPMAARITDVLPNPGLGGCGAAVERNDADGVHHLVHDRDMVRRLKQLHVVVVDARQHRRSRVAAHQAPVGVAEVQVRLRRADRIAERRARAHRPRPLPSRLRQRGHPGRWAGRR